jgi:DegV family protein with EDD domain
LEEAYDFAMKTRMKIHHSFVVDDLSAIQRSGRISHLAAMVGTVIGVKPILAIGADGKVQNTGKVRGRKAGLKQILTNAQNGLRDNQVVAICHADVIADAESMKAQILAQHPNTDVILCQIGPIIGINTGVNTVAAIYVGDERI